MDISSLVTDYLEYLEIEKNRSQKTISNYDHYLSRLVEFTDDCDISKLDNEMIRQFRLWLARNKNAKNEPLSKVTQNYHLIAIRSFLKYLASRDIKTISSDKIELAKTARPQVGYLDIDELDRLFNIIDIHNPIGLRDRAIIELLYSGGLRVSELVNLDIDHINVERREFMVRGKGQKDRPIYISDQAAGWLERYLSTRKDDFKPLFIHYSGSKDNSDNGAFTRLTARSIQRMVKRYASASGITKHVTPHTLRHSFATNLIHNGADIRSVQGLLGHENISTTQIYTHISNPHLKDIHSKYHR